LRDLPEVEALEDAGLLERGAPVEPHTSNLDEVLGLTLDEDTDPLMADAMPDEE